ncbi:MAG TPA: SPOR domain-containing protein [Firmicutes bacterium]|nr:SPOR domain-containing protein [Bacillota bacterium]
MEKRQVKALTTLLTKVAGLVFFAFLAISLGVIFGTLFKDWVHEEPFSPVQGLNEPLQTADLPPLGDFVDQTFSASGHEAQISNETAVTYKVRIGPFQSREQALSTADILGAQGYPVYVSKGIPCYIQVGAFANPVNADKLKAELGTKGFNAFIHQE